MIIVKLMGGLGNQMFQYAAARSLALRHCTNVKVDISFLPWFHTARKYQLHHLHLSVEAEVAKLAEMNNITYANSNLFVWVYRGIRKKVERVSAIPNLSVFRERHFGYNREIESLPDNTYLDGYWQSEMYFKDIQDKIWMDFQLREPLDNRNIELAKRIRSTESISVHVRRGDYVSDPNTAAIHGVCGSDYYRSCFAEIGRRVANPCYYIFSDDPEWTKRNLDVPGEKIVVYHNPPEEGHLDMHLMSLCRHNIIANSSFSWWGAWLNRNPGKTVLAPKRWFQDSGIDPRELLPDSWILL